MNRFHAENASKKYFEETVGGADYLISLKKGNNSRLVRDFLEEKRLYKAPENNEFRDYLNESCFREAIVGEIVFYRCS
ncbi:MAG: hypothetical protein GF334_00960 [Candidatus Altiarchaeales archaeon]|nr:hypothetical protein [Candidatus Altiarchaeales archaeon]